MTSSSGVELSNGALDAVRSELEELGALATLMSKTMASEVVYVARVYADALRGGHRLYFAGNGGSAADAQHVATEYIIRFSKNRRPLPAVALTTDTSVLTACGNDLSFEDIFARQVEGLCVKGDVLVLHSTSGMSENIARAAQAGRIVGATVVALLGRGGGRVRELADLPIVVPSHSTSRIQEMHLAIQHAVCGLVERELNLV